MSNALLTPDVDYERLGTQSGNSERLQLVTGEFAGTVVDARWNISSMTTGFDIVSSSDSDLTISNVGLQQRVSDIVASIIERSVNNTPTNPTSVVIGYDSTS